MFHESFCSTTELEEVKLVAQRSPLHSCLPCGLGHDNVWAPCGRR